MKTYNCPACGAAMRYSDMWKMWSCENICIEAHERVLTAIEKRQAEQLAAAKPDSAKLATFLSRKLFELGDKPGRLCKRIQFMTGEFPLESPTGGFVEDALARALKNWILEHEDTKGAS